MSFKISITKEDLVFAAAHFITYAGHRCEKLHGHNYRVSVVVEGALEQDSWYVVDFSAVKKVMRALTGELDHRVLLPRDNPQLAVVQENGSVRVAYAGEPRYVFPAGDCVILPIPNTTAETLSQYLAGRARPGCGTCHLEGVESGVGKTFGRSASSGEPFPKLSARRDRRSLEEP